VITACLTLCPGLFLPLLAIPGVKASLKFRSSLSSAPEPEVADSVPVSERSGINQPFAIEGDALPELNLTFAGREDPLDEHTMPNSEPGADEAPESESA